MGTPRADRAALRPAFFVVLTGAVLLEVAYILLFSPFVTDDGALHIGSAAALVDSIGGFELGDRFLEWNPVPAPSVLANLLLALLLPLVGVDWAERLVVVFYVCALPAATLYAIRSMRPGWGWLACFAVPMTFSYTLLTGFFNFSYSIVAFLLTAGFLLRSPLRMSLGRSVTLGLLLLLTFFSHLVGYAVAGLLVVLVLGMRALLHRDVRAINLRMGLVALVPSGALAVAYVVSSSSADATSWGSPLRTLLGALALEWGIVTFDGVEAIFSLAAAVALGALVLAAALARRPWSERDPDVLAVGLFTLAVTLIAAFAPDTVGSGGAFITQRLVLFPVFGALLWLASQELPKPAVVGAASVALAAAAGLALVRYDELRRLEGIAQELKPLTACVADGSTMVQGNLARVDLGPSRSDPLTSETGKIAADTDGLDLGNADYLVAQWVQRYAHDTSPEIHLFVPGFFVHSVPPPFKLAAYERATGAPVDYVILSGRPGMSRETAESSDWRRFNRTLEDRYRLVVRSSAAWWELWVSRARSGRPTPDDCREPGSTNDGE